MMSDDERVEAQKESSQLHRLLQNLERLLSLQAQEIARKNIESVVQLSGECAEICQQLKPILMASRQDEITSDNHIQAVAIDRLIQSCQALQQNNSQALVRLASYCDAFIALLREPPLSYGKNGTVTYLSRGNALCKL
ncbi:MULTISPECIES: hypothetical protein [Gammaproteobacteria]|uniref:hypothetical protein n=1 Tax=Gammaproteobacteria TaxID=1236 RepID=UPI001ADACFCF|nr:MULTISPECIES: hypothetical protein [Gammaproteobacteria]MBO9480799.1 hypothetical protein [Salinisphaera sp. G21_0]MBO9495275.1 hypothetical protein [Thalassotalea sp. G20_0]